MQRQPGGRGRDGVRAGKEKVYKYVLSVRGKGEEGTKNKTWNLLVGTSNFSKTKARSDRRRGRMAFVPSQQSRGDS